MIIYKTINLINRKIYIGKDVKNKKSYYGSGNLLKSAIKKYGKENFKKEIIEKCSNNEELCEREKYWIKKLDATNHEIGYNISKGGIGGIPDLKVAEITKNKISASLKNRKFSKEHREKLSKASKGKPKSKEHREKLSKAVKKLFAEGWEGSTKGKKHSKEACKKISLSLIGTARANKSITIDGVKYLSIKEAAEKTGMSFYSIRKIRNKK
jgi:group I intron endonuclease